MASDWSSHRKTTLALTEESQRYPDHLFGLRWSVVPWANGHGRRGIGWVKEPGVFLRDKSRGLEGDEDEDAEEIRNGEDGLAVGST